MRTREPRTLEVRLAGAPTTSPSDGGGLARLLGRGTRRPAGALAPDDGSAWATDEVRGHMVNRVVRMSHQSTCGRRATDT